eukprot:6182531-Pleurochrysis_carterae.AAC.4
MRPGSTDTSRIQVSAYPMAADKIASRGGPALRATAPSCDQQIMFVRDSTFTNAIYECDKYSMDT